MSARRILLLALVALSACKGTSARPGLRLSGPSAVAVFRGLTTRDAATVRSYLAVANERGDDLRLLDAVDGRPVLAPGLVQSLSVPTAPRPALLAAGGLADVDPAGRPDLLVVAPAGLATCDPADPTRLTGCVQVVATWAPATALASDLTLVLGEDQAVLSLAVVPVPEDDGAGGFRAAAGRARLLAGLSGGRFLVADYARASDGVGIVLVQGAVHDLGFDLVSLSASPTDPLHAYAASPDPILGVEGVAELDLRGAVNLAPAVRPIPAGAPTTHVLAATVRPFVALTSDPAHDQHGPAVTRLYAALDPGRCGLAEAVACGLAVLDPASGPLPDPASELPAHAPIPIFGSVLAMTAVYPPALGSLREDGTPATSAAEAAFQKQSTAAGFKWVSTLAAVASTDGAIHMVDLARGTAALDRDVLATTPVGTQAQVSSASTTRPTTAITTEPYLALWDERTKDPPADPVLSRSSAVLPSLISFTPGYAPSDVWSLTWEGVLPGLVGLRAEVKGKDTGDGLEWLAVQSFLAAVPGADPAARTYRDVARLYDPRLAIHAGDIVVVTPTGTNTCPGAFELEVTGFLPPSAEHPGGAVTVEPRPAGSQTCFDGPGLHTADVTFRASGLILTGSNFGYAGRPLPRASAAEAGFTLGWEDTSGLSCPILADPAALCDQACRDACERIVLARKTRRLFYLTEQCPATDTVCQTRWGLPALTNKVGPVLSFKPGFLHEPPEDTTPPARDTKLLATTQNGQVLVLRRPLSGTTVVGAALPSGLVTFDRSAASNVEADGIRVYAAYPSNTVIDFTPAQPSSAVTLHK